MSDTEHRTETVPAGSTDRLESILESMPAGFIAMDREFRLTYLNRHAEVLFEYAREEVLGKSIWEVFPEVRGGDLYRAGVEGMDERGLVDVEFYYEPKSEWYEIHAFPVDDGMAVYFTNVTARKRGEEALEAEVERLGRVIEIQQEIAAGEPDLTSVMQVVADRACELTGATGAGVQIVDGDESVYRAVSGKTGSYAGLRLKLSASLSGECIRTGEVLTCEDSETDPRVDRDACRRTGVRSIVAVPLVHRAQVVGALTVLSSQPSAFIQRDVRSLRLMAGFVGAAMARASEFEAKQAALAERTQALHALTASEERFRNLFAHAAVGEATVSLDGRYLQVNPALCQILGYEEPELVWREVASVTHPEDREATAAFIHTLSEDHVTHARNEKRYVRKDGGVIDALVTASVVRDADGAPQYFVGLVQDVTEQRRAERAIEEALRAEREATARLRDLDEMKNTFLSAVSHELRTPLASVLGFALTLQREDMDLTEEERRELLGRLASNARKLDRLLSDLLDLDRLARGILEPQRRPTDIGELARRVVAESSIAMGERPLKLDADGVVASVDGPKVERIVENLVANAVRHTEDGTPIWVRVARSDGGVLISVEDAGPGVPEGLREAIFEPFRRGPDARIHAPGVGIGLSLVARFAELHDGWARVIEREGGGASFRVWLPCDARASSP